MMEGITDFDRKVIQMQGQLSGREPYPRRTVPMRPFTRCELVLAVIAYGGALLIWLAMG